MAAVHDLDELLATMRPELDPTTWVFTTGPSAVAGALMTLHEREGVTSIVPAEGDAPAPDGPRFARITLTVHSDLEAVGLTAAIATALAAAGIPANVVAGYFHDHVFVPVDRAEEALQRLQALSAGARARR